MMAAPARKSMESGSGASFHAGTRAYSAYDPIDVAYATRSPTRTPVTPGPTFETMPEPSAPGVNGMDGGLYSPLRTYVSTKFTPETWISTRASPGPGSGTGISSNWMTSGPP